MPKLRPRLLLLFVLGIAAPSWAQLPPAHPAAPAPASVAPAPAPPRAHAAAAAQVLAPAQAQQVLDLLRDDKRRAEFTSVLEAIATAAPPAVPGSVAAAEAPAAAPAAAASQILPLTPGSLGAQVIDGAASALSNAGAQAMAAAQAVNDLPLLWRWVASQASNEEFRARAGDVAWRLLAAIGAGLALEAVATRVLRRLRRALSAWTPTTADWDPAPVLAEPTEADRHNRLGRALGTLRRLPYLFGRLVLDLIPVAAFAAAVEALAGTRIGEPEVTRLAIRLVLEIYVLSRIVLSVTAMLVSPAVPRLRLLHLSDWAAAFLTRWIRRCLIVAMTGYGIAELGLLFGMYRTAHDALLKLFALAVHGMLIAAVLQARPYVAARLRAPSRLHGVWAALLNRFAQVWHLFAIFYIAALWLVWAAELRNGYVRLLHFCLVTFAILMGARLLAIVLLGGLDRLLRFSPALAARHPGPVSRATLYQPLARAGITTVISAGVALTLLEAWNLGPIDWLVRNGLGGRVASAATVITVTLLLAAAVWEGTNAAIEHHLAVLTAESHLARAGRLRTLLPMLRTSLLVAILIVAGLMVLSELGINIAPLLAGAGVIGIAVGFGSQKLVQDLITGLFLLLENAMQVGDVVTLGGLTGTVEALSIRTIRLRAIDGAVHIIPFSAVTTVTNQTRDYGYALLDISVGLNEEPNKVIPVVRALAAEMRADPQWASLVIDELDVMGVEKFIDTAWVLRVRMKTQPASRWKVGRELNRRVKLRFDELAIESPVTSYKALSAAPAPEPAVQEQAA